MNKIGLIAGNGRFPFLVADEIRRTGDQVIAVALKEETDPALEAHVDRLTWLPLGKLQKLIDAFREEGVSVAIMAGQVKHARIYSALNLDLRAIRLLGRIANKKTDSILGAVADELAGEGIRLLPSHQYLKHLMPEPGIVAGPKLSKEEKADIEFGLGIAKHIAAADIGQTVVVKDRSVLAIESVEGTDECIKRAALYGGDGVVVVKVAKPNQDWRFDIPVIGPRTIATLASVKARVMAIESGSTLLIDRDQLVEDARKSSVTIAAV